MKFLLPVMIIVGFFVALIAREWLKSREQAEKRRIRRIEKAASEKKKRATK